MSVSTLERPLAPSAYDAAEVDYRAVSSLAVASVVIGLVSFVALFDWSLAVVPAIGLVTGGVALVQIRSRPRELTGRGLARAGALLSLGFLVGGPGWLTYSYLTEVPEGYRRVSYDLLQPAEGEAEDAIPQSARDLDGQRVFLKGYVFPSQRQTSGIRKFILCRDNGECCFGGDPKLTDMILVTMQGGATIDYSARMFRVAGTFRVAQGESVEGLRGALYQLEADLAK